MPDNNGSAERSMVLVSVGCNNTSAPIGDIRGLGAMVAFELVKTRSGGEPDPETTKALCAKALENGLVLLSCGVYGNTVRILVPLTADDSIVDEGLEIIERSLTEIGTAKVAA